MTPKTLKIDGKEVYLLRHHILKLRTPDYEGEWLLVYYDTEEAIFLKVREILSILNDGTMTKKHLTDQELDSLYKMTYLVFGT